MLWRSWGGSSKRKRQAAEAAAAEVAATAAAEAAAGLELPATASTRNAPPSPTSSMVMGRSALTPAKVLPPIGSRGRTLAPLRRTPSPKLHGLAAAMGLPPVLQVASAAVLGSTGAPMTPLRGVPSRSRSQSRSPRQQPAGTRSPSPDAWDSNANTAGSGRRDDTVHPRATRNSADGDGWSVDGDVPVFPGGSQRDVSPLLFSHASQRATPSPSLGRSGSPALNRKKPRTRTRTHTLSPTASPPGSRGGSLRNSRRQARSTSVRSATAYDSDDEAERLDELRAEAQARTRSPAAYKGATAGIAAAAMAAFAAASPAATASNAPPSPSSDPGGIGGAGASNTASPVVSRAASRSASRSGLASRLSMRLRGRQGAGASEKSKRAPPTPSSHLAGAAFSFVIGAAMGNLLGGAHMGASGAGDGSSSDSDSDAPASAIPRKTVAMAGAESVDVEEDEDEEEDDGLYDPQRSARAIRLPAIRALEPTPSPAPSPAPWAAADGDADGDLGLLEGDAHESGLARANGQTSLNSTLQLPGHRSPTAWQRRVPASDQDHDRADSDSSSTGDESAAVVAPRSRQSWRKSQAQLARSGSATSTAADPAVAAAAAAVNAAAIAAGIPAGDVDDEVFLRLPNTLRRSSSMSSITRSFFTAASHDGHESDGWDDAAEAAAAVASALAGDTEDAVRHPSRPVAAGSLSAADVAVATLSLGTGHSPPSGSQRSSLSHRQSQDSRSPAGSQRGSQVSYRRSSSTGALERHSSTSPGAVASAASAMYSTVGASARDRERASTLTRQSSRLHTPQHVSRHSTAPKDANDDGNSLEGRQSEDRWRSVRSSFVSMAGSRRESIMVGPLDAPPQRPAKAPKRLLVHIVTWNMNEQPIPTDVSPLARPAGKRRPTRGRPMDLYVVGTQEGTIARRAWELKLQEMLGPRYVLLHSHALMGIQLCVFVRRPLVWFVRDVESAHVATKLGGMLRTKGAVGISMVFNGTRLLFIDSHLAAHTSKVSPAELAVHRGKSNSV